MENVEKLEKLANESNKWVHQVETLVNDPDFPYISDLVEFSKKAHNLPVTLKQLSTIDVKINMATDWMNKLIDLFLKPESIAQHLHNHHQQQAITSSQMNEALIEVQSFKNYFKRLL